MTEIQVINKNGEIHKQSCERSKNMNELQVFENQEFGKIRTLVVNHEP